MWLWGQSRLRGIAAPPWTRGSWSHPICVSRTVFPMLPGDRVGDATPPPRLTAACPQEPPPPALGVWGQAHRQGDAAPAAAVSLRGRLYSIMCY